MAAPDFQTLVEDLLTMDSVRLDRIREQARSVVYGGMKRIDALSKEAEFDVETAGVVMAALNRVTALRAADPAAVTFGGGVSGHRVVFRRFLTAP